MRFCAPYHRFDANQALKGDVWFGSLADIGERIKDVRRPAPGSPFLLLHFGHFTFVASCSVIALERLAAFFATILVGRHVNTRDQMVLGAWKGGAYTDDKTGAFSHCAASTPYVSGIYFVVSVTRLMTWNLGFAHPAWNLREGESIPIARTFDGRFNFNVVGSALRVGNKTNLVIVPMPDNSALIDAFRRAYVMKAYAKGREFGFNLTTTALLLPALVECVRANQNMSSFNTGQPEVPLSPELQMEAVQSATNFILKSGLQNPRVLSRAETPAEFASFGAAWTSDEAVGAVKIVPPDPTIKGLDVAAAIAGADAKECKGKFASGRVSELVDSEVVFRGFSTCEDTDGARMAEFFVVPRKLGGFVIFSVATNSQAVVTGTPQQHTLDESNLVGFQKAALSAAQ